MGGWGERGGGGVLLSIGLVLSVPSVFKLSDLIEAAF